ncbi:MAG: hypothetical protein A3E82_01085 [Gammaproteobacteria bacterium RIFCSPHIGHO2_12_FULL_38_11]|nr:MAG: hypothetical protein A3E82_01085 [Gammaproteobacteria bacterium RIFCSPHIGHO2_12_FULL_38_11]
MRPDSKQGKDFGDLYNRNLNGAYYDDWAAVPALIFFPVTLLGALAKTTADYNTRKEISAEDITALITRIDNAPSEEFAQLCEEILKLSPKSRGSQALKKILESDFVAQEKIKQFHSLQFALNGKFMTAKIAANSSYAGLSPAEIEATKKEIIGDESENLKKMQEAAETVKKNAVKAFLLDSANCGKATQHAIRNFFNCIGLKNALNSLVESFPKISMIYSKTEASILSSLLKIITDTKDFEILIKLLPLLEPTFNFLLNINSLPETLNSENRNATVDIRNTVKTAYNSFEEAVKPLDPTTKKLLKDFIVAMNNCCKALHPRLVFSEPVIAHEPTKKINWAFWEKKGPNKPEDAGLEMHEALRMQSNHHNI